MSNRNRFEKGAYDLTDIDTLAPLSSGRGSRPSGQETGSIKENNVIATAAAYYKNIMQSCASSFQYISSILPMNMIETTAQIQNIRAPKIRKRIVRIGAIL